MAQVHPWPKSTDVLGLLASARQDKRSTLYADGGFSAGLDFCMRAQTQGTRGEFLER